MRRWLPGGTGAAGRPGRRSMSYAGGVGWPRTPAPPPAGPPVSIYLVTSIFLSIPLSVAQVSPYVVLSRAVPVCPSLSRMSRMSRMSRPVPGQREGQKPA